MARGLALGLLALTLLGGPAGAQAQEAWPPPECGDEITVDVVGCVAVDSDAVGGVVPVAYFVPSRCTEEEPCPVLYQLHGFAGSYQSQLGTADSPSGWVHALTARPPVDPAAHDAPWEYADPATWEPAEPIDFIFVAPHGRTVPGGFGPEPGLDSFWADWNPRHTAPPPRFTAFLVDELLPFVEARVPTLAQRDWRALTGVSLGGYGAFKNALQHPDVWGAVGSVSGAHNFLFAPAPPASAPPDAPPWPFDADPVEVPGLLGGAPLPPGPAAGFAAAFHALGDPVADRAWYRGNMPVDLARNARAFDEAGQVLAIDYLVNDAVARRPEDYTDPERFFTDQAFEGIVYPMNTEMELAFDDAGVDRSYAVNPGIHANTYWNPFLRGHIEALRAGLVERGDPEVFDYRSVAESFAVWGWAFSVDRGQPELFDLTDVSCESLTLRGTGVVSVTVPERCGTGLDGTRSFTVDLGAGAPVVGPTGVNPAAQTAAVALSPLTGPTAGAPQPAAVEPEAGLPATGGRTAALLAGGVLLALAGICTRRVETP